MIKAKLFLKILLWLIAIHSCIVGIILISSGTEGIKVFGFEDGNPFFQVQGGFFYLVMCVAYLMASYDVVTNRRMLIFIIIAKCMATVFLLGYYSFVSELNILLLSGIVDGLMAVAVLLLYLKLPWNKLLEESLHG